MKFLVYMSLFLVVACHSKRGRYFDPQGDERHKGRAHKRDKDSSYKNQGEEQKVLMNIKAALKKEAPNAHEEGLEVALDEIRAGKKLKHWIWYVFPQHIRHSRAPQNLKYSPRSLKNVIAYLKDPELKAIYIKLCIALYHSLATQPSSSYKTVFSSDAIKVNSSLTLFYEAAKTDSSFDDVKTVIINLKKLVDFHWNDKVLQFIREEQGS